MAIGPFGDSHNVPVGECAVRLARKGDDLKSILSVVSFKSTGKRVLATVEFTKLSKDGHFAGTRLPKADLCDDRIVLLLMPVRHVICYI